MQTSKSINYGLKIDMEEIMTHVRVVANGK